MGLRPKNWWVAKAVTYYVIFILCRSTVSTGYKVLKFHQLYEMSPCIDLWALQTEKNVTSTTYKCTNYQATPSKKLQCHPLPTNSNYRSTWAALAQIILILFLPNFSERKSTECRRSWKFNHHRWPDSWSQPVQGSSKAFHQSKLKAQQETSWRHITFTEFILICQNFQNQKLNCWIRMFKLY
jgi:hypothetical protein